MCAASCLGFGRGSDFDTEQATLQKARALIANSSLFRNLSTERREALLARARIKRFRAHETIFQQGDPGDAMMAIVSGAVRITVLTADGKEVLVAVMHSGDLFGEIALLDRQERTAHATAMTPVTLAVLQQRDIWALLEAEPDAYLGLIHMLCSRIRRTTRQLAEIAALNLTTRLARTLLRETSENTDQLRFSQQDLANLVGATREAVNKCLQGWQVDGIVHIHRNIVTIADRVRLERISGP